MAADLGKPELEGWLTDIAAVRRDIEGVVRQVGLLGCSPPGRRAVDLVAWPGRGGARTPGHRPGYRAVELPGALPRATSRFCYCRREHGGGQTFRTGPGDLGVTRRAAAVLP